MSRLTKLQAKAHAEAERLLEKDVLTEDEKEIVRRDWQESANHVNSAAGAFFTPMSQARDFALEVQGSRVIDLCAGIGNLAAAYYERYAWSDQHIEVVCVEVNPDYVRVGRKLVPEATWIVVSIFDMPDLGRFDVAISNPPFGKISRGGGAAPRYSGAEFEYHVVDMAAHLADMGSFILPASSAPFSLSGKPYYQVEQNRKYEQFSKQTGIELSAGMGIDTTCYGDEWHGVKVPTEHCVADFREGQIP